MPADALLGDLVKAHGLPESAVDDLRSDFWAVVDNAERGSFATIDETRVAVRAIGVLFDKVGADLTDEESRCLASLRDRLRVVTVEPYRPARRWVGILSLWLHHSWQRFGMPGSVWEGPENTSAELQFLTSACRLLDPNVSPSSVRRELRNTHDWMFGREL